jgi:Spy/CpxP family protein refolding chaperone
MERFIGTGAWSRYQGRMIFRNLVPMFFCVFLLCFLSACGGESKSDPNPRNAQDVMGGMRLKQMTKELDLTAEQQAKVKELLAEEGKLTAKVQEDANLSAWQKTSKVGELHQETYAKMKPLLDPAQMEKFETMLRKMERRKKTN